MQAVTGHRHIVAVRNRKAYDKPVFAVAAKLPRVHDLFKVGHAAIIIGFFAGQSVHGEHRNLHTIRRIEVSVFIVDYRFRTGGNHTRFVIDIKIRGLLRHFGVRCRRAYGAARVASVFGRRGARVAVSGFIRKRIQVAGGKHHQNHKAYRRKASHTRFI